MSVVDPEETMRAFTVWAALGVTTGMWSTTAEAQSVVVPETPFTTSFGIVMREASAMLDDDSAIIVYQEDDLTKFQVVNTTTGATELPPTPLALGVGAVVGVLGPDAAMITMRAGPPDGPGSGPPRQGVYYVVNPLTGAIAVGPILFHPTLSEIGSSYRLAVADRSTVLIEVTEQLSGKFIVVDPERATVTVPLTTFEDSMGESAVVALDEDHVVIAYTRFISGSSPKTSILLTIDPHTGTVREPPLEFDAEGSILSAIRVSATEVLVPYRANVGTGRFLVADIANGSYTWPTAFVEAADGDLWDFAVSPVMLGPAAVLFTYWRTGLGPGLLTVFNLGGQRLLAETAFNPEGPTYFVSSTAANCRALIAYQDVNDAQKGKFQVLDFSDLCTPPPCPADVTGDVGIFRSGFVPFLSPLLQLQLVLVQNTTSGAIPAPMAYAVADLQNAMVFSQAATTCVPPVLEPFVIFDAGADGTLSPNEVTGSLLLFLRTSSDPITYAPRLLSGVPVR